MGLTSLVVVGIITIVTTDQQRERARMSKTSSLEREQDRRKRCAESGGVCEMQPKSQ